MSVAHHVSFAVACFALIPVGCAAGVETVSNDDGGTGATGASSGSGANGGAAGGGAGSGGGQGCTGDDIRCGDTCVDTNTDTAHCGMCDNPCAAGETCDDGLCCGAGTEACAGVCANTATDVDHCGMCGNPCGDDEVCDAGMCVCDTGFIDCGGSCIDPATSTQFCGAGPDCAANPGVMCAGNQSCIAGQCACPAGEVACAGACVMAGSCVVDFAFTGAMEMFPVPPNVGAIDVEVAGAWGGSSLATSNNAGGLVTGTLPVMAGDILNIFVGEKPVGLAGGFNGGGAGDGAGNGGGGASDIRLNGATLTDRVVVAGGGGGAGFWATQSEEVFGGQGGGLMGTLGFRETPSDAGGAPGTQTASGTGTCVSFNNSVVSGGLGFGGTPAGNNCGCDGYGGGGGYYGGAGSGNCRGGGGGSGFAAASVMNVLQTVGGNPVNGHGFVRLTY